MQYAQGKQRYPSCVGVRDLLAFDENRMKEVSIWTLGLPTRGTRHEDASKTEKGLGMDDGYQVSERSESQY